MYTEDEKPRISKYFFFSISIEAFILHYFKIYQSIFYHQEPNVKIPFIVNFIVICNHLLVRFMPAHKETFFSRQKYKISSRCIYEPLKINFPYFAWQIDKVWMIKSHLKPVRPGLYKPPSSPLRKLPLDDVFFPRIPLVIKVSVSSHPKVSKSKAGYCDPEQTLPQKKHGPDTALRKNQNRIAPSEGKIGSG